MKYRSLIPLLLMVLLLTGCGSTPAADSGHPDNSLWYMDRDSHWLPGSDGQAVKQKEHTIEDDVCTVCGAVFSTFDDGELWVQSYNDHGDNVCWLIYDADGELTQDTRLEYTYDENGHWATMTETHFGALYQEITFVTYAHRQENITYAAHTVTYNADGTRLVEESDHNGPIQETLYDGETVVYDYTVVCEYNGTGLLTSLRKMDGDTIAEETQYTYAKDGQLTGEKSYVGGKLVKEDKYKEVDGFWTLSESTSYFTDGTSATINYDSYTGFLDAIIGPKG